MRIAGVYSFNQGKEAITKQFRSELEEVLQVIEAVDKAEGLENSRHKAKVFILR